MSVSDSRYAKHPTFSASRAPHTNTLSPTLTPTRAAIRGPALRAARNFPTRLTNAFSKRVRNHAASVALWVSYDNLCRVHATLRTTPAMAMGVTDHIWTVEELIVAALAKEPGPDAPRTPPRGEPEAIQAVTRAPARFTVLRGGKDVE